MTKINGTFSSIEQVAQTYLSPSVEVSGEKNGSLSFQEILAQKTEKDNRTAESLKFSKHASQRLEHRKISLSAEQSERLESGVSQAKEKGIRDSLILMDTLAFIVNVPNNTVVTAMEQTETNSSIFTNIDGAVII